jgi:glucosamine kinase
MSLVLAVDAGQTGTVALVARPSGEIVGVGRGAGCERIETEAGARQTTAALKAAVTGALGRVEPRPSQLTSAYLALTAGIEIADRVVRDLVAVESLVAEHDVYAALASGSRGRPGVGLIAGTGAVAVAVSTDGTRDVRGGWGHLLGDEGSGYWLGMRALHAAAAVEDGRVERSPLYDAVLEFFNAPSMRAISKRVYADQIDRPERAGFAPIALRLAAEGDPLANTIVDDASAELARLVLAAARSARIDDPADRVVVTAGGLMRAGNPLLTRLEQLLSKALPGWKVVVPRHPPVVGALYLALRQAGIDIDDAMEKNIATTLARHEDALRKR